MGWRWRSGPVRLLVWEDTRASQRSWQPISVDPLYRTSGGSRGGLFGRLSWRQLRQRPCRDDHRPLQNQADSQPGTLENLDEVEYATLEGSTGSITADCWNRSATSRQRSSKLITGAKRPRKTPKYSSNRASDKPGAIHYATSPENHNSLNSMLRYVSFSSFGPASMGGFYRNAKARRLPDC